MLRLRCWYDCRVIGLFDVLRLRLRKISVKLRCLELCGLRGWSILCDLEPHLSVHRRLRRWKIRAGWGHRMFCV